MFKELKLSHDVIQLIEFCYPLEIIAIPQGKKKQALGLYNINT